MIPCDMVAQDVEHLMLHERELCVPKLKVAFPSANSGVFSEFSEISSHHREQTYLLMYILSVESG